MVLRSRPGEGASFLAFWSGGSLSALAIKLDVAPGRDHPRSYRATILGYRWVSAFLGLGYRVWDRTSLVGQKTPGMKGGSRLQPRHESFGRAKDSTSRRKCYRCGGQPGQGTP